MTLYIATTAVLSMEDREVINYAFSITLSTLLKQRNWNYMPATRDEKLVKLLTRRQGWYIQEWVGRIDTTYKNANWQTVPLSTRFERIKKIFIQRASWTLAMARLSFALILYVVASERSQAHSLKYPVKRDALNSRVMNSRNTAKFTCCCFYNDGWQSLLCSPAYILRIVQVESSYPAHCSILKTRVETANYSWGFSKITILFVWKLKAALSKLYK